MYHILRAWVSLPETQIVFSCRFHFLSTRRINVGVLKEMHGTSVSEMQITEHNGNHQSHDLHVLFHH